MTKEKDALEAEFRDYRQQIEMTIDTDAAQELRMLRGMVRSLEEELTTSQAKHQRLMLKRSKQCRLLIDEVSIVIFCVLLINKYFADRRPLLCSDGI